MVGEDWVVQIPLVHCQYQGIGVALYIWPLPKKMQVTVSSLRVETLKAYVSISAFDRDTDRGLPSPPK